MGRKSEQKPDDTAQSKRFIETAREIEADEDDSRADELMGKLSKQPPSRKERAK